MIAFSVPRAGRACASARPLMPMVRMSEDVVAASDAVELPAAPLQPAYRLARRHRR